MLIKAGVDISRLNRETRRGLAKVSKVYEGLGEELVVTSTYEGNHGAGSLHYADDAFDVRYPRDSKENAPHLMRLALGPDFDVVEESNHIHVENDPK